MQEFQDLQEIIEMTQSFDWCHLETSLRNECCGIHRLLKFFLRYAFACKLL